MADPTSKLELRDIPDPRPLLPSPALPWWAWLSVALILVIFIIFLIRKKSPTTTAKFANPYRDACAALEQASAISQPTTLATTVSLAFRRYLATALADPSLFETHEEFLSRHQALNRLPADLRHDLALHFSAIARLKYAPRLADASITSVIPDTRNLLDRLHALPPASAPHP